MKTLRCPNCAGVDTKTGRKNEWRNVMTPRVCLSCGHEWEPPPPVWAMALCVVAGFAGLVIAALRFSFAFEFMPVRITLFSVVMVLAFGLGLSGLIRRKPKVIVQGRRS